MKSFLPLFLLLLSAPSIARADAGILLPKDKQQPDPKILSLSEMWVEVLIDNGDAHVSVRQVFANHTPAIEEGNYIFALPGKATISDFAVWDGPVRIPAVILERKRAEEIYAGLKAQAIDPGLLEMGERDAENVRQSPVFSARIVPIPRYGTKRLEIEYHQTIPVENLKSFFALPLHPDAYQAQSAGKLHIHFTLRSAQTVRDFQTTGKIFPLKMTHQDAHLVEGSFDGENVNLIEDFATAWAIDAAATDKLEVLTYRNPRGSQPSPDEMSPERPAHEPGYFETTTLLGIPGTAQVAGSSRTVVVLMDTSLSMQWDKLERSYAALEKVLRSLRSQDQFNVLLFNSKVSSYQPKPVAADPTAVKSALEFVRASHLRGGTNLEQALNTGLAQCGAGNNYLVLLSDGGADQGTIQTGKLAAAYTAAWKHLPEAQRPHTYVFGVGDDMNQQLLRMLSRNGGVMEQVLSTEPVDFKLDSFVSKIGRSPAQQLGLKMTPDSAVKLVYPLQDAVYTGSLASWVGQYAAPKTGVEFGLQGELEGKALDARAKANLPAEALEHDQLPRLWAAARVEALLEQIARDGETREAIDEIIRLARKYKLVTPYTSFLAVPRALLRPRVIRPGDPVLRVKTDPSIESVIALFPFGLTKPLRYLPGEDIWQTRFLAPTDMQDGTYSVRLILRDRTGHTYREAKTFVIASTPPTLKISLDRKRYRRGEMVQLKVSASQSTRTLTARLEGSGQVSLRWSQTAGANIGQLEIPPEMPPGSYRLTVTAEDVAHNIGTQEVQLEIVP